MNLENRGDVAAKVQLLEKAIYAQQVKVCDVHIEIIREEEKETRRRLNALLLQAKGFFLYFLTINLYH